VPFHVTAHLIAVRLTAARRCCDRRRLPLLRLSLRGLRRLWLEVRNGVSDKRWPCSSMPVGTDVFSEGRVQP